MRSILLIFALLLLAAGANAQDANPNEAFTDAWQEYVDAKRAVSESKRPRLKTELVAAANKALDVGKRIFTPMDERLPLLMVNYGDALLGAGDKNTARDVLEQALDLAEDIHGDDSEKLIPMLTHYADARAEFRNSSVQERYYRRALKILGKQYGEDSIEYADIALRAGFMTFDLSKTVSDKRFLRDARAIYVEQVGQEDSRAGMAAFYLGKLEMTSRHYKTATSHFLDALIGFQAGEKQIVRLEQTTRAFLVKAYESRGMSDKATEHCLAIGANSRVSPDQDYQPLFRMAPKYPSDMLSRRKEGYVDVSFTVDASGFVRNPVVLYRTDKSFDKATIDAVERFRYAPRFEDGEPVAVADVKTRIKFKIEK